MDLLVRQIWRGLPLLILLGSIACTAERGALGRLEAPVQPGPDSIYFQEIPFTSSYTYPDHTSWGINMRRIARDGDSVFTYYIDNSGYCQKNPGPGVWDCDVTGGDGWSYLKVLRKQGLGGDWEPMSGLSFRAVRPGNLLLDPKAGCIHLIVFEPHTGFLWRQADGIGALRQIWFSSKQASPPYGSRTIVSQPPSATGPESVNIRVGASIAPDGRIVVAWGSYTNNHSMNFRVGDGVGCDKSWSGGLAQTGLPHDHYYPRVHVGGMPASSSSPGNPSQLHYTAILAQMDHHLADCDGEPEESIYRKLRYWEDSRDGSYLSDSILDLWSPCSSEYDRVNHTDVYIDAASRTHIVFAKMTSCASSAGGCHTSALEHWIKPGDSFKHGAGVGKWTRKVGLYWAKDPGPCGVQKDLAVNEVRLFEADPEGDGNQDLFYVAVSNGRVYLGQHDETRAFLCADDLVEIHPQGGWPSQKWGGLRINVAGRGGGTLLAERFVDMVLFSAVGSGLTSTSRTFYIRVPKESLPAILARGSADAGSTAWADAGVPSGPDVGGGDSVIPPSSSSIGPEAADQGGCSYGVRSAGHAGGEPLLALAPLLVLVLGVLLHQRRRGYGAPLSHHLRLPRWLSPDG